MGGVTFDRRQAYLQLVSSYLHVLDSTLPTGHVRGRLAAPPSASAPATAGSTAAKSGSRAHTGYLPRVDDMLSLTEAPLPLQPHAYAAAEVQPAAGEKASEDPFAASAAAPLPEGLSSSAAAEGSAAAVPQAAVADAAFALKDRERQLLQDDSDSDLEADIVFAHVMARRPSGPAAHASSTDAQHAAAAPDQAGSTAAPAVLPAEPADAAALGASGMHAGRSQQPGAAVPEEAAGDLGAASQQTQDINSRLMASLIHSSPGPATAEQDARPGTSHASLPPPEPAAASAVDGASPQQPQQGLAGGGSAEEAAGQGSAGRSEVSGAHAGSEAAALQGRRPSLKRASSGRRAKPAAKAVAAMWTLLEASIAPPAQPVGGLHCPLSTGSTLYSYLL